MSTYKLSNVSIKDLKEFLIKAGCKHFRTNGGHEIWGRCDLKRPIVIQTHVNPVSEFVLHKILKNLKLTKQDFFNMLFLK